MDGFVAAIEQHRDLFYRFVLRNVWDPSHADDVFASAVLSAFENRHQFVPGTNFRAWMFRVLANKCFVANRETMRESTSAEPDLASALPAPDSPHYAAILEDPAAFLEHCGDEVFRAFRSLSTAQRMCILLKDVDHFSYQEIAEILAIPVATVITHLGRGRARLRAELVEYAQSVGIFRLVPRPVAKGCASAGSRTGRVTR
jgi:RNA polymerase sigma-70 factor (ECF subfamily)